MKMTVEGRKGGERPKNKWLDAIRCDKWIADVCVDDVGDRVKWRFRTKITDLKYTRIKAKEKKKNYIKGCKIII